EPHLDARKFRTAFDEFQQDAERHWPEALREYKRKLIKPNARDPGNKPDSDEVAILKKFQDDPSRYEDSRSLRGQNAFFYYGAVRATGECLKCHGARSASAEEREDLADLKAGDLMALVRVQIPTQAIEEGFHLNRAILLSAAIVTAMLIMA